MISLNKYVIIEKVRPAVFHYVTVNERKQDISVFFRLRITNDDREEMYFMYFMHHLFPF